MTPFIIIASLMLGLALAFPLLPLLRRRGAAQPTGEVDAIKREALDAALKAGVIDRGEYRAKLAQLETASTAPAGNRRPALVAAALIALLLPAAAIGLYAAKGTPVALDPARMTASEAPMPAEHSMTMDQAVAGLVAKLEADPGNADGWALLGRAYQSMGKFAESRDALKRAHDLVPDNADLSVEYAQALALATPERRIDGEARALIDGVLNADPGHQRALWLVGISDYQAGRYTEAIAAWNRLLPNLPPGSDIEQSVKAQIAEASQLAGIAPPPAASPSTVTASAPGAAPSGPHLAVQVSLAPALASQVDSGATLFVYARAQGGPPMPLAIQRRAATELPLTVSLDDSMGMMPSMKLSMFPKVIVGARISRTGNAMPQSGDLQGLVENVDVNRSEPVQIVIDSVLP